MPNFDVFPGSLRTRRQGEGAVAGAAAGAILLGIAVWELCRKPKPQPAPHVVKTEGEPQVVYVQAPEPEPKKKPVRKYRTPVPAAIARQRAHFAAEGQRMMARRRRH